MYIKKLTILILIELSLLMIGSCDRVMPGGFWDKFETDLRIEKQNDQGPWGGTKAYFWKSRVQGYFNKKQILDLAQTNSWNLIDSIKYSEKKLEPTEELFFRVKAGPFEPSSENNFLEYDFPKWIKSDLTLFKFKTDWLIFYPGTDNSTQINGFVLISEDGKEMTVYYLWGE